MHHGHCPYGRGVTGCRCVGGYYYYLPCNLTTLRAEGRSFEWVWSPFFPITRCSDQRLSVCWYSTLTAWISWGHWFHPDTSPEGRQYTLMRSEAENTGQFIPSVQLSALYPLSGSHSSPARCPHQGEPCASLGSLMTEMPSPEEAFVSLCCCSVGQLCPTLCDPMDCSPPGSWFLGPWGFSRQEYQSGLPCLPPGIGPLRCPADSLPLPHLGSPSLPQLGPTVSKKTKKNKHDF